MALTTYLIQTQQLLQNAAAVPNPLYTQNDLVSYINRARVQIAGTEQCIRTAGQLVTQPNIAVYPFGNITFGVFAGYLQSVFNVRMITAALTGGGMSFVDFIPWEFFNQYYIAINPPVSAITPKLWTQYGEGNTGSILLYPTPTAPITLTIDSIGCPIPLTTDATPELLPPMWTDCVPFFAAFLALLSSQSGQRTADADRMWQRYQEFAGRARAAATSDVLPYGFERSGQKYPPLPANVRPVSGQK